jgi:hypothetical protein
MCQRVAVLGSCRCSSCATSVFDPVGAAGCPTRRPRIFGLISGSPADTKPIWAFLGLNNELLDMRTPSQKPAVLFRLQTVT